MTMGVRSRLDPASKYLDLTSYNDFCQKISVFGPVLKKFHTESNTKFCKIKKVPLIDNLHLLTAIYLLVSPLV